MADIDKILTRISPIAIKLSTSSINLSLSRRFFMYDLADKIIKRIEEDPYLNFIALLKTYKLLGRFLYGTVHDFHRDRNKTYFKNFFPDRELYELVKKDLEDLHKEHKHVRMMITKRGLITYDNYQRNKFNVLLLTVHSGTWLPDFIEKKLLVTQEARHTEEDLDTHKIYRDLVLKKGGIWVDNKQSRFVIDLNRSKDRAIYYDNSEYWLKGVWSERLSEYEQSQLFATYKEFYFTLSRLISAYRFNIIFDGHSMNDLPGRPSVSIGTHFIPNFYMPIVQGMRRKMRSLRYGSVLFNTPYGGGNILRWLSEQFPDVFTFSMEVNKSLYLNKTRTKSNERRVKRLSKDIMKIFDIEVSHAPDQS